MAPFHSALPVSFREVAPFSLKCTPYTVHLSGFRPWPGWPLLMVPSHTMVHRYTASLSSLPRDELLAFPFFPIGALPPFPYMYQTKGIKKCIAFKTKEEYLHGSLAFLSGNVENAGSQRLTCMSWRAIHHYHTSSYQLSIPTNGSQGKQAIVISWIPVWTVERKSSQLPVD